MLFEITSAGVFNLLHSFNSVTSDGSTPLTLILGGDGNLYGTTNRGGANGAGTIFEYTPGGVFSLLYNFTNYPTPNSLLRGSDGNLYGTTNTGGSYGNGAVFRLSPTSVFTTLHSFSTRTNNDNDDGANPPAACLLEDANGNFYGVTNLGGAKNDGTIYKLTPTGVFTTLYSFNGTTTDGSNPTTLLIGSDGNFYGTTTGSGFSGDGTVFKLTAAGAESIVYSLTAAGAPDGLAEASDGTFYGTTNYGGNGNTSTVFQLSGTGTPGSLEFSAATASVNENAGSASVVVTRSSGSTGAVAVSYATANGTAMAGTDYATSSGTLSWSDGDVTTRTVTVTILNPRHFRWRHQEFHGHPKRPHQQCQLGQPGQCHGQHHR